MARKVQYTWSIFVLFVLLLVGTAPASASDGESKFAKLDGARIHYKSYGKGNEAATS
jgi:hypothetical protein